MMHMERADICDMEDCDMEEHMKIVVLEAASIGKDMSWEALKKFGEVVLYDSLSQKDVKDAIKDADIIIPNKLRIDESVLEGSSVRMVCEAATGYNNIDIAYCHKMGITVTNVKGYSTKSVAQHTIALLLSVYEKLNRYSNYVQNGDYAKSGQFSKVDYYFHEINGKTWGIVGLGAIGRETASLAQAFGARIIYYSASGSTYDVPYEKVDFDTLLEESDIVSIHCPLNEYTEGLFDEKAFAKMKSCAVLINVARGPVVQDVALAKALKNCEIMAAGLDVFEKEPLSEGNPLYEINDRDTLLMTPHIGWGTVEARTRLLMELEFNIEAFLKNEIRNVILQ